MMTKRLVSCKNEVNAKAWCALKGYRFLNKGAFDVYYITPEQEGQTMDGLSGTIYAYSSENWLKVFDELRSASHKLHSEEI